MKKIFACLLSTLFILAAALPAFAAEGGTTYYVDSIAGDDANSGTSPDCALKTPAAVSQREYGPGDKILFHAGQTYCGTLFANGSGTKENPITVSSYGEGSRPRLVSENAGYLLAVTGADYWAIDNLDFTNPYGGAMVIDAMQSDIIGITVTHCGFYDISLENDSVFGAAIVVDTDRTNYTVQDLHISHVEIQNTHWGIHVNGCNAENENSQFISPAVSYNSNFLFENIKIDNASCGGMVIGSVRDSVVRCCRVTNSATAQDAAYAPLWLRHSNNVLIEYCEIAGAANTTDGMAVDFDGWTTNCTYDHIYSHDNTRFVKNCVFDAKTRNRGNKVTNCISVNDNKAMNHGAVMLFSTAAPSFSHMSGFTFSGNTVVNGSPVLWLCTPFAKNEGNTFSGSFFNLLLHRIFNLFSLANGNTYIGEMPAGLDAAIQDILSRIA